jgi:hypothetical protein
MGNMPISFAAAMGGLGYAGRGLNKATFNFGKGGFIPSYKLGDFPIPRKNTLGNIGIGAGLGAFLGSIIGSNNQDLLPILMITGILGGGVLGNFVGERRRKGFDLFGNLLPTHGNVGRDVGWSFGKGGRIRAFNKGGLAVGPSHQSGIVGYAEGGEPFLFEGGEYIIRKDSVDALGVSFFDAVNEGALSFGRGGVIPSFQEGTSSPSSWLQMPTYGRRDVFGLYQTTTTNEEGETVDTYITNIDDFSSAGIFGESNKLLQGITEILKSIMISTTKQEEYVTEDGETKTRKVIDKLSSLALETSLGVQLGLSEFTNVVKENEYARNAQNQLVNAKGEVVQKEEDALLLLGKGSLMRVQLDLLGGGAAQQFTMAVFNGVYAAMLKLQPQGGGGGGTPLEDALLQQGLPVILEAAGLSAGAAGFATAGILYGRATAEDGKADIATAAGLAAAMFTPPGWAAIAALAAAEVMGKPENYFAEVGMDEQMDVQEPITGFYDELFNDKDGAFTYPAKYIDSLFKERLPDVQARLDEGAMRMNMNSQKLASKMENIFGLDEGALQFDMGKGIEQTYESINSLSKIGDRLGELQEMITEPIEEIVAAIAKIINFPADFFNNLGEQLQAFFGGSLGELLKIILSIPLQIANAFEEGLRNTIGIGLQEFIKNILALFLGIALFPVTILMMVTGKMGETVDEFLLNLITFTGAIALLPLTLTTLASLKIIEGIDQTITNLQNTFLFEIINLPITLTAMVYDYVVNNFLGSFMGVFDSFLGQILMIPNMLLQETINFVTALPARLLEMFGIKFPGFSLKALKNPFYGNLGGPEYLINLKIGEESKGDGGLVSFANGGQTQTGGLAVGPSHQSGMLGLTSSGTPFLFEGGEYIINKEATQALGTSYLDNLNQMKKDTAEKQRLEDAKLEKEILMREKRDIESKSAGFSAGMQDNKKKRIFNMNNPISKFIGPSSFSISIDPAQDLAGISLDQNIFESGGLIGTLDSALKATKSIESKSQAQGEQAKKVAETKQKADNAGIGNVDFSSFGDIFNNEFEWDLVEIDNPLGDLVDKKERERRTGKRKRWYNPFSWGWEIFYYFVDVIKKVWEILGPDKLSVGFKGNLLKFWESKPVVNFGGDVLDRLGVSMPSVSMENGGYVSGLPHYLGGVLAELEGGEYVINKDSARRVGSEFLGDINNTTSSGFVGSLVSSSFVTNDLLAKLIQVVDQKEMSVTVVDSSGEEKSSSNLKISREREMSYRGARMLA